MVYEKGLNLSIYYWCADYYALKIRKCIIVCI